MKKLTLVFLLAAFGTPAHAQYAGSFARFGFGARSMAMGGTHTADVFGQASPYHNPALAPYTAAQHLEVSAAVMSFDRQLQHLQFAAPLRPSAGVAIGVIHGGVSGIDGRDGSGYHTEDYSTNEYAFFLAFGTRFSERISAGVGLRIYRADLFDGVDAPTSLGISLGFTGKLSDRLAVGLAVDDLLAKYDWDTSGLLGDAGSQTTDKFPIRLRVGAAFQLPAGRGVISAEVESQIQTAEVETVTGVGVIAGTPVPTTTTDELKLSQVMVRVGGEYWLAEPFAVRLGYDRLGAGSLGEATPSAGFAIRQQFGDLNARLDYAAVLEPFANGLMHVVTLHVEL